MDQQSLRRWAHRDVGENLADFTGAIRDRTSEDGLPTTHETAMSRSARRSIWRARTRAWPTRAIKGMDFADASHLGAAARCEAMLTFDRRFIEVSKGVSVRVTEP